MQQRYTHDVNQTQDAKTNMMQTEAVSQTVTMVTMGGDLQPGCLADRLLQTEAASRSTHIKQQR